MAYCKVNITELKYRRIQTGLTQGDFADRAFLSRETYNRIENGTRSPSLKSIKLIAMALECDAQDFVDFFDITGVASVTVMGAWKKGIRGFEGLVAPWSEDYEDAVANWPIIIVPGVMATG